MVNNISNVNSLSFRGYNAQSSGVTNPIADNTPKEQDSEFFVNEKAAAAIKSYNAPIVNFRGNNTTNSPISLDEYKSKLVSAGKTEGKDFKVTNLPYNGDTQMTILSSDGKNVEKTVYWTNGTSKENYDGCVEFKYPNDGSDLKDVSVYYDKNGNTKSKSEHYINGANHKELFPENIDINTSAKDYIAFLEKSGANFEAENFEEYGEKLSMIAEKDKNGNIYKMTSFSDTADGLKFINQENMPNKDGVLSSGVDICIDGSRCDIMVTKSNE